MNLKRFEKALRLFPITYFALAALSFCSVCAERNQLTVLSVLILLFGGLRFIATFPVLWRGRKFPITWVCLGLFVSFGLSMLANASYGIIGNLKGLCWLGLCLFVLLPSASVEKVKGREGGFDGVLAILIIFTGIAAVASLILMVSNVHVELVPGMHIGTYGNRLFGVYTDPNYGGVLSVAAAMASLMLILTGRAKSLWLKIALWVHIALQYLYVVFGYSRTSLVVIVVGFSLAFLYYVFVKRPGVIKGLIVGAVLLLLCTSFQQVRDIYNGFVIEENEQSEYTGEAPAEIIERSSDIESDMTNIRIPIWGEGVAAFLENPILGISYRNIEPWFKANRPDSFINTYANGLNTFHNVFVDVLASQGALGILLFVAAIIMVIVITVKFIPVIEPEKLDRGVVYALPALIVMGGSLAISDILYVNTPTTVLFWYCLGQWLSNDPRVCTLVKKEN